MPGANSKLEGSVTGSLPVGSTQGRLTLEANPFFDGRIFDPMEVVNYLDSFPKF